MQTVWLDVWLQTSMLYYRTALIINNSTWMLIKAVANGPVGEVLAGSINISQGKNKI